MRKRGLSRTGYSAWRKRKIYTRQPSVTEFKGTREKNDVLFQAKAASYVLKIKRKINPESPVICK